MNNRSTLPSTFLSLAFSLLIVVGAGCHFAGQVNVPDSIPSVGSEIARTRSHIESADRHVIAAVPHADAEGRSLLGSASYEHQQAIKTNNQAAEQLTQVAAEREKLNTALSAEQAAYRDLHGRWYVRWGIRIQAFFWIGIIGLAVLEVLSLWLGFGNPFGWMAKAISLINIKPWVTSIFGFVRGLSGHSTPVPAAASAGSATGTK